MINAFVYKEDQELFLVPLASEKKIPLKTHIDVYQHCDNKKPLNEHSIVMCWYDEVGPDNYITKLAVVVDLLFEGKKVAAKRIRFDDLVGMAFKAAIQYTKRLKQD